MNEFTLMNIYLHPHAGSIYRKVVYFQPKDRCYYCNYLSIFVSTLTPAASKDVALSATQFSPASRYRTKEAFDRWGQLLVGIIGANKAAEWLNGGACSVPSGSVPGLGRNNGSILLMLQICGTQARNFRMNAYLE